MLSCSSRNNIKSSVNTSNVIQQLPLPTLPMRNSISKSSKQPLTGKKEHALIFRLQHSAVDALGRYKRYVELGRNFSTNAEVVAFYNDTIDRIAALQDNKKRVKDKADLYKRELEALISALDPNVASSNDERQVYIQKLSSLEKKQSIYDAYANQVMGEFEGNRQVIENYIEDFFKQYHSNPSHTSAELVEMANLAALKHHKPTLDRVRENLVNEILQDADEATFSLVSVASVEGLSVAIGLFPPEYLHDQNEGLINIVVRVIEVIADRTASYDDNEKRRLIIAIRNMVEGVASSKSLERTQQATQSASAEIVTFMKAKIPENPFRTFLIFQKWLKESDQAKANGLFNLAGEALQAANQKPGITPEQRAKLNKAVGTLHRLVENQPRVYAYVHAGIKAEISNIPTQGEPTSLETLLTTIWHTVMIAKSIALIVTSSGALLVKEGIELVDHLIAMIPKPGEKPQEWNKYAKDLRALRAQANQLANSQFSAQLIKYCIKLIESGSTNLNLEYEIFRSISVGLQTCDDQSINIKAVQMVAVLVKADGFKKEDKDMRRQQALNMMLDFMTCSRSDIVNEAYSQLKSLQSDYTLAMYNLIKHTWGNEHIRHLDLTVYNNRAKLGENTNYAQLAFDDEVKHKSSMEVSSLVRRARNERFKFQETIANLTQVHKRLEQSNEGLYISVNGHPDPENMNSDEWINIMGQLWAFLENEKSVFILHGAMDTGKRAIVDHLVYLLLRYRRYESFYPVRVHIKNLTGSDVLQQALQAEGWSQNRIDELRQRFSVKASSVPTRQAPDPALPELLLFIVGVGTQDCPPQFMQHIKERWGREFKCMLVTGERAFGLSDYANIFSSSLTQKQVREKVQEFYIQPQVTKEQLAMTLYSDAATREYRNWMKIKHLLASFDDYTPQEADGVMSAQEDFPPAASWVKKHYQCVFTENAWLRDLATTPVMLRMLIRMAPKLFAGKRFQQAVSREDFLRVFIQTIFDEKLDDLKKDEPGYHYSDKRSHHFFILYSRKAALHILQHQRPLYSYTDEAVLESSAKKQVMETDKIFFDTTNSAAKYGLLLSPLVLVTEGQYEFINSEVWVYFVIEGLYHEIIDCVHGQVNTDSILNNTLLYDTRDVFRGLLNLIRSDVRAQIALYKIVLATKTNKALDIAASNAMTLLVRVRSFSVNKELAGTSFSKANLNGGIFDFACLDRVDMNEVSIERCDFSQASVNHTKMSKVKLSEPDTYKMGETIAHAAFSEDGRVIVLASDTGSIACYRDKALATEEAIFFLPGYRNGMLDCCKETNQLAAVANGWLEIWSISTKQSIVGPAHIGELYGKAQGLLFCQDGSTLLVSYPGHVLIFALDQLTSGKVKNSPLLLLPKTDKWGFKLSFVGNKIAYFSYNSATETVSYCVTDVATGDLLHEEMCSAGNGNFNGYSLTWVKRYDLLLIQTNDQIILCHFRGVSHSVKTKYIQASRYEIDEEQGLGSFLCEDNTLKHIRLDNIDDSTSEELAERNYDDFGLEIKDNFLEQAMIEHIIPQGAGKVALVSNHPLRFNCQRAGSVYQLEMNEAGVLVATSQHSEVCDEIPQNEMVMAKDGNGLVAIVEKGGRLRLERHHDKGSINPMESRLYNVPDIVALHFVSENKTHEKDTQALLVVCADGTITFWDFDSHPQQDMLVLGHDAKLVNVIYSPVYEDTYTLDSTGKLIKWNKAGENQVISSLSTINEMTLCPSGKHIYLFNQPDSTVSKFSLADMSAPLKTWSEVKQYCVMRRDGAFIYLTQSGELVSERTVLNGKDDARIETHQLIEQGKIISMHYLSEADRVVVNVTCNMRDMSIPTTKLMVYADSKLDVYEVEYFKKKYCYSTPDGACMITQSVQGRFYMHNPGEAPIEITHLMLKDVDRIKAIKLVADLAFVHYVDNSLSVWDYRLQKLSIEAIENVDDYSVCPSHDLLLVRQGMTLLLYQADCKKNESPTLLPANMGSRKIHEVNGCVWFNETTFASFHTNHAVKIWQVTQDGCQQMNVLGSRRFYCKEMSGHGMDISPTLQLKLNRRGANLNESEPVAQIHANPLDEIVETVTELKKQNQLLLSQVRELTFLYKSSASVASAGRGEVSLMPPMPPT